MLELTQKELKEEGALLRKELAHAVSETEARAVSTGVCKVEKELALAVLINADIAADVDAIRDAVVRLVTLRSGERVANGEAPIKFEITILKNVVLHSADSEESAERP